MAESEIDVDEEALALAAEVLGTRTVQETVNAALMEVVARVRPMGAGD
ncbi:type II toxin-antitoxin system VapB family antitoxin [Streptomyces polychromogenes]|nr:type II toxin-antitoxin system VapB family antitoxin [Streptomyces polychromogenes]